MDKLSPITHTPDTKKVSEFSVTNIISLYEKIGINVSRFFSGLDKIELYQCDKTGYRFYYPFSIFGDDQFYQDLYSGIPNYYYPDRWEYGFALSNIPPDSRVLEIGSGAGLFLQKLTERGSKAVGLELNSKAIADSKKKGLDVHAADIESYAINNPAKFDVVCSFQVLEHVTDVSSFIAGSLKTLKPGGLLILSVPNSHPYFLKYDKHHTLNLPPHHAGLWNKSSLQKMAEVFPIKLTNLKTEPLKEYKEWYQVQIKHYETAKPWLSFLMKLVPRPLYKFSLRLFSSFIQGSYLTAIYRKL